MAHLPVKWPYRHHSSPNADGGRPYSSNTMDKINRRCFVAALTISSSFPADHQYGAESKLGGSAVS
jgi:hypothetical protein